ncbi:peptidylprolyl isomerase [Sulfitobacter pseudonitzschiae]|uniref:Parvulin-like PPIase n=1 Tax=Pseudosulfitobacter pseudonitzschiae TaxID=1402135 RepID=A0A9Q2RQJ6_9RHOB|nr:MULTISPECIES: peptidylprolyl isomerase [Roseobacteraceae]MBM2290718.1 peptidylprolyl isomerase [Pseudosulfitobacter pseudonitzschiae]MBM2295636.1 peptidylprolyl isomerase [Pseudosulfitobacter pseudonitzschiae]MBM2300548.1 peptidylprolyl isomerase [Pseudosulfitobacter pseudonitzschiae]MBM2310333.1 peptidylprolyl isomerase [Pseudosulfitobacter pseudonitzschiae]MBM2315245.1 peptidylprolyl isomerase [Pseudosulfitobacter pseudonitzschiae]|tara:strand:+ start:1252 stop:2103 length:852 start_codon:yes stop_codon:yes gene_type:complete
MLKRLSILPAVAVALTLSQPLYAQDETPDLSTVVATVDGTEITLGHMLVAKATLPQQYQQLPDEVLFPGILDQLIQQTALEKSYEGDVPKRVELSMENERRSLIAGEAIEKILATAVSDEAIQAAYDATYANAEPTQEFNASHILVETEDEAKAIIEELNGGADFAATAREKSTGPSGPGGGSLGWFGPGAMVPEFETAVAAMKAGDISEPVQTQFGWHVIKLNEVRNAEAPALEDVRAELEQQVRSEAVTAAVDALVADADVNRDGAEGMDPSVLSTLKLGE